MENSRKTKPGEEPFALRDYAEERFPSLVSKDNPEPEHHPYPAFGYE